MSVAKKKIETKPKKPKVPAAITKHFRESVEAHEKIHRVIYISRKGIRTITAMPKMVEALERLENKEIGEDGKKKIAEAQKEADLAVAEIEADFPVLHGLAVIALWSWLEHGIKGFIALWLAHHKGAIKIPALGKLRIKMAHYMALSKSEQMKEIVDLMDRELDSEGRSGVNRFESLLEPFGLSGAVSKECAHALNELQQVRNLMAHRNGKVDRQFKSKCPWIKVAIDKKVNVKREMFQQYSAGTIGYFTELLYRVGEVYGIKIREPDQN